MGETDGFLGTRFVGREARERAEAALELGREEFKRRVRFANLDPAVASIVRYTLASRLAPQKTLH